MIMISETSTTLSSNFHFIFSDCAHTISGLISGCISTFLLYPLEILKVRLQVQDVTYTPSQVHIFTTAKNIFRHEGIQGFYRGIGPSIVSSSLAWSGYFTLYENFKTRMEQPLGPTKHFLAACTSSSVIIIFLNPVWVIKTRLQLQMKKQDSKLYKNFWDALWTIKNEEGIGTFYRGIGPALLLTSHSGVQFVCYEWLKEKINSQNFRGISTVGITEKLSDPMSFLTIAVLSKIMATTTTYPLQVIKTRLQQQTELYCFNEIGGIQMVQRKYRGVVDCTFHLWKNYGIYGFYKGVIPNAIRVAPGTAITFVVYESLMDWFRF